MNCVIKSNDVIWCFRVLRNVWNGETWRESHLFPRITLCDFPVRQLGNVQHYTVQCSLPLNLFNEIIYIFVWFWFAFVAIATVCSCISWCVMSLYIPHDIKYVKTRLITMDHWRGPDSPEEVGSFVRSFLRRDGLLLLRLVGKNSSDMIASELLCGLWLYYKRNRRRIERIHWRQNSGGVGSVRFPEIDMVDIMRVLSADDSTDAEALSDDNNDGASAPKAADGATNPANGSKTKKRRRSTASSYKSTASA